MIQKKSEYEEKPFDPDDSRFKYEESFPEKLIKSIESEKLVTAEMAMRFFGVTKDTFYKWVKRYPDFAEAENLRKMYGAVEAQKMLIDLANGKVIGNSACAIFLAKNLTDMKDKKEFDINEKQITVLDDFE